MKKLSVFLCVSALLFVIAGSSPQISSAAATLYGIRFDLVGDNGVPAGVIFFEFDAIDFNEWFVIEDLSGLNAFAYANSGSGFDYAGMDDFIWDGGEWSHAYGELMISDEEPWYPVSFRTDSTFGGSQLFGVHIGLDILWPRLDGGVNGRRTTSGANAYTAGVWFDDPVPSPVPIPSAIWLLGSGLIGIVGFRKKL